MKLVYLALAAAVLLSACVNGPSCERPYKLVYGECCLDENDDGICDIDKPVCRPPYILYNNDCCLDSNLNHICDRDESTTSTASEAATSTTATTTSSSTTSTTLEAECVSMEDCVSYANVTCDEHDRAITIHYTAISCLEGKCLYRSSREISSYPCGGWQECVVGVGCVNKDDIIPSPTTSTTLTPLQTSGFDSILDRVANKSATTSTTSTTLPGCFDADGRDYDVRSVNVSGRYWLNDTYMEDLCEYCIDADNLLEYYCESGQLKTLRHECANRCLNGRCCVTAGNKCAGDRDCCSGDCRSIGMIKYCVD